MNLESIVNELRGQRSRIDQAIAALQGSALGGRSSKLGGRNRRQLSAAARVRIGAAKKAWWAKQKRNSRAAKKPTLINTAKRKPMSSAARKKLSTLMTARWNQRRKAA